jgi:hypothetical protein
MDNLSRVVAAMIDEAMPMTSLLARRTLPARPTGCQSGQHRCQPQQSFHAKLAKIRKVREE